MGIMTRDEIQEEVLENLENRGDVTDAQAARWINHALLHMTHPSVHEFEDLAVTTDITLVPGQASYPVDTAALGFRVLKIRSVSYFSAAAGAITTDTRNRGLKPKTIQWYDRQQHPRTEEPSHYVPGENQTLLISFTPNNTNTVRLRVQRQAAPLDTGAATTVLPDYFDDVLVTAAQARFEFKLGDRDRSNETFQYFNSLMANARDKANLEGQSWGLETSLSATAHMRTT